MNRNQFIRYTIAGSIGMTTTSAFNEFTSNLDEQEHLMPALFVGHGSPMNGIEDTDFSRRWTQMATEIQTPKAVLVISAHWLTRGTKITAMEAPQTIHDFGGFPQALFDVQYPAPGNPELARETVSLVRSARVELDHEWGLDHGTWTIVRHMYPQANIPVIQLSIDYSKGPQYHYDLAKELSNLRKKGVLIIGSGNMIHNLQVAAWDKLNDAYAYDWALNMNETFKGLIQSGDHKALVNYASLGKEAALAIPTPEHYLPLMYTLGLKSSKDSVSFFNDKVVGGSLNMTSVKFS